VVSHHFKRHRALAMGIVAAGTAAGSFFLDHVSIRTDYTITGATAHPIILNHLFYSRIGFHNGVRVSAGINSVCFILANIMMRTSQSCNTVTKSGIPATRLFRNPAYNLMVIA